MFNGHPVVQLTSDGSPSAFKRMGDVVWAGSAGAQPAVGHFTVS